MNFTIRRARHEDALSIIQVLEKSIQNLCAKDYTVEQITAWSGRKSKPETWCQAMDRDYIWVVVSDDLIMGFGQMVLIDEKTGEITGLYLLPSVKGHGLGKRIFREFFNIAREFKLSKLTLHSTLTAKGFYQSIGFFQNENDTTIEMNGVAIPCHPMELSLVKL